MKAEARNSVEEALVSLRKWIEGQDFKGWDPYDALNSPFPFHRFGKWGEVLAIQAFKRSPMNLRPLFGVRKELNPKAMGLLLNHIPCCGPGGMRMPGKRRVGCSKNYVTV